MHTHNIQGPSNDQMYKFPEQELILSNLDSAGRILDLGGGGEGTIEKLEGERVTAISLKFPDKIQKEAATGALKIIMDARDLKFLDNTFQAATSFFTLMYIPGSDHAKVFSQAFRVLVPGGKFFVWEANILGKMDDQSEKYAVILKIQLPNHEISTGYGNYWPEEHRDLAYYIHLAEQAGFKIIDGEQNGRILKLLCTKLK